MDCNSTTLCLVPQDTWFQPDWSRIGCEVGSRRKVCACLTSICTYENNIARKIRDWDTAVREYGITVQEMHTYDQLVKLMSGLTSPQQQGLFVYNGVISPVAKNKRPSYEQRFKHKYRYKTCMSYPHPEYAASCASSLAGLWGFDPDISYGEPFTLGWFAIDDTMTSFISRRYDEWPDNSCEPMLPAGPSPSCTSVELAGLGRDMTVIGLFAGEANDRSLQSSRLRELLDEDTIIAYVEVDDFWHWLEYDFSLDDLRPVDRSLPFQI